MDISNPSFDPDNASTKEIVYLINESDGKLIDLLKDRDCSAYVIDIGWNDNVTHSPGFIAQSIYFNRCHKLTHIEGKLKAEFINIESCSQLVYVDELEADEIHLDQCHNLVSLPKKIKADTASLAGCKSLINIDNIQCNHLNLYGCISLNDLPNGLILKSIDTAFCLSLPNDFLKRFNIIITGKNE